MNEKIERLKAELVVFKGLMSDVSATAAAPGVMTSPTPIMRPASFTPRQAQLLVRVLAGCV